MSNIVGLQIKSTNGRIATLKKQYEAIDMQINSTLDDGQKVILTNGLTSLVEQINENETKLAILEGHLKPDVPNESASTDNAKTDALSNAGIGNSITIVHGDQVTKSTSFSLIGKLIGV